MARVCKICRKRPMYGHNVSHANNRTKRRWLPNLKRVKANLNGMIKTINVCTKCIKAVKVTKVIRLRRIPRASEVVPEVSLERSHVKVHST